MSEEKKKKNKAQLRNLDLIRFLWMTKIRKS